MDSPALTPLRLNGRTVDVQRGTVTDASGHVITLRPQAAEVLKVLAARPGALVTKDELVNTVWGGIAVTDDSLVQCITDIRKALGDDKHEIVRTVLKRGYVLEAGRPEYTRAWPRRGIGLAAAILAAAVAAATLWLVKPVPGPVAERVPTIAVLPFDDMSADKSLAYMGDGVAEDIITMLARAPDVRVIARNSSFTYKGKPADIRSIGQELGVGYVLEGSVRQEADKLRIVAQLNDARTGEHLWAERFDKAGADPWALQDEVTGKIIGSLTGESGQLKKAQYREAWGKDTATLGEYDYHLRGHDVFMKFAGKEENDRAGRIWKEGLSKFPDSALLKVDLGFYHWLAASNFLSDDMDADFRQAGSLVREVLAEDNLTPQVRRLAHWLFAFVLTQERDFKGSVEQANAVAVMGPYDAFVLPTLSEVLLASGQYDEALEWIAMGEARNPIRHNYHRWTKGWIYCLMGKNEEAVREFESAGPLPPDVRLSLSISHVRLGHLTEARAAVQQALKENPDVTQAMWRKRYIYSDPAISEGEIADLARAGLPEK